MSPTKTGIQPVSLYSVPEYQPTALTDFSDPKNKAAFEKALAHVRSQFGKDYTLVIDGDPAKGEKTFESINPSNPSEVIGRFQAASREQAGQAIDAAAKAFKTWSRVPAGERAAYLMEAARRMRERRHEFSAWMVFETGKNWVEADADTAEAIDFMEFYAREMLRFDLPTSIPQMPGEKGQMYYIPLGVGAIIPPWNFPLAIAVGMSTAAIVAGNTAVLKPSSDSPATAWQFFALMEEIGLPRGVLSFLTGGGGTAGDALVRHPKTRFVSFTGSMEVGIGINKLASEVNDGQIWLKRIVSEMGGKNATIVEDDADLDAAAQGVVAAAYGFQGQKCSACSRAIVHEKVYDAFIEKVKPLVDKITVGAPDDRDNFLGPVINENARKTILGFIEKGKKEGKLIAGGGAVEGQDGWFVQPTVIQDIKPTDTIAQEEIFGPVLAIIKSKDYAQSLEIANGTRYGLTGAVFTKDKNKIARAKREFHVGNLYINRKCTGAIVGAHPFGGFNMSGTDSKAGGADYLLLFMQAKTIAEKVK